MKFSPSLIILASAVFAAALPTPDVLAEIDARQIDARDAEADPIYYMFVLLLPLPTQQVC